MIRRLVCAAALGVALACSSNSSDGDAQGTQKQAKGGECGQILDACHTKDDGNAGPVNDCHVLSHTFDDDQCVQRVIECVNLCTTAPCPPGGCGYGGAAGMDGGATHTGGTAGTHMGSGGADVGGSAGTSPGSGGMASGGAAGSAGAGTGGTGGVPPSLECVAYCDCVADECSTLPGYPWASKDACLNDCATFSSAELACWQMWCDQLKTLSSGREHLCEHAWGKLGLNEC